MMRRRSLMRFLPLFLTLTLPSTLSFAANRQIGLGLVVGHPTGLTSLFWLEHDNALAFSLGVPGRYGGFSLHADYLSFERDLFRTKTVAFPLHFGPGVELYGGKLNQAGLRFPVGVSYFYKEPARFQVYFEVGPSLLIAPVAIDINAALGFRFFL